MKFEKRVEKINQPDNQKTNDLRLVENILYAFFKKRKLLSDKFIFLIDFNYIFGLNIPFCKFGIGRFVFVFPFIKF